MLKLWVLAGYYSRAPLHGWRRSGGGGLARLLHHRPPTCTARHLPPIAASHRPSLDELVLVLDGNVIRVLAAPHPDLA
ncbi:MAG: hypothetical protein H6661_06520 [Ardenticatenaceae bacterium]|nr:hypothetical protein [Ardenticatenaceae bacterium]